MRQRQKGKQSIRCPQRGTKQKSRKMKNISLFTFSFVLLTYPINVTALGRNIATAQAQKLPGAVKKGFDLLKKGLVNDAIATFKKALKSTPRSLQARLGLAIAYRRAGRLPEAWSAYQRVLEVDGTNQLALKSIGLLGTYRPEWNLKGIEALTTLLRLNPNDGEARGLRATLYSYQGRFAEAIADYQIALNNNPTPDTIVGAAQTYSYTGDFPKALELFNRYKASGQNIQGFAAVAYGRTLRETGNPAAAVQILEAQLRRDSGLNAVAIETRKELAIAYLGTQQQAKALAILDPLRGRSDTLLPLARALNEIRKSTNNPQLTQQVSNLYRQALANNPNPSSQLLKEIGDVFTGLPGGKQTALQLYQQAVAKSPNDKGLLIKQLALSNKLGLLTKNALKQRLFPIFQNLPNNPAQLQPLALGLADIDDPDPELLPIYQSFLQAQANSSGVNVPFLYFRVAQIYLRLNDMTSARQALAAYTTTSQGKKDLAPQLLAAEIERREGNLQASAQRYQALLGTNPSNDIVNAAWQGLAGVRLQQKRYQEALAAYDQLLARNPQNQNIQLGRTSIAYQAKLISQAQAEAVLNNWLATQPATNTPPELFSLVTALPTTPQREPLYNYLAQVDSSNIRLQLRLVQAIAERSPARARARVKRMLANLPRNSNTDQLQAELAKAIGDFDRAGKAYERILATEPDNTDALAALGGIRFEQRQFESAQQAYTEVVELNPDNKEARRALAGLNAVMDKPLAALAQLEQLQLEQMSQGTTDVEISRQMQQLREDFLLRRGFQPPWESYERRGKDAK
ncbi:MAG: tetratricopeptide repeat protein [Calothrix sp. MO_192.B10]|nr:tetratricopeptide repeat protein [Calothrix sp. MO_192.B10]